MTINTALARRSALAATAGQSTQCGRAGKRSIEDRRTRLSTLALAAEAFRQPISSSTASGDSGHQFFALILADNFRLVIQSCASARFGSYSET